MTTPITINGSWYIIELNQQEKDQPNSILVLDWGRGLFCNYEGKLLPETQQSVEDLPEIHAIGKVKNTNFLYENQVNYWESLRHRKLIRTNDETFEGIGNLSTSKYNHSNARLITSILAEEILQVNKEKPHYLDGQLYVIRYRDSRDRNTNPFHQTAIIAKDEADMRTFRQNELPSIFDEGHRTLQELVAESNIHLPTSGIIVMPEVISYFHKKNKGEHSSLWEY